MASDEKQFLHADNFLLTEMLRLSHSFHDLVQYLVKINNHVVPAFSTLEYRLEDQ